ncbi:MAG TPA: DUF6624 domain-containing protein [Anaerolineales bacterium]|nr:DUF6624 domain-containing protein [Anaerolineales bacterium]
MEDQLRDELLQRVAEEQRLREEWINRQDDAEFTAHVTEIDAQNTIWLDKMIEQVGWPGNSLVGEDGANAAFLIIQHSPDLGFQKKCLGLMESTVAEGEMNAIHLAYLADRVRMREGKPQYYGTQGLSQPNGIIVPAPIEDEQNVDERRKAIGLEPIAEYFKQMNEFYKTGPK